MNKILKDNNINETVKTLRGEANKAKREALP